MATITSSPSQAKLPPTTNTPQILIMIRALLDQFGTLVKIQPKVRRNFLYTQILTATPLCNF